MPVIEIRDTIDGKVTTNEAGFGYLTRRINLPPGLRSELLNLDVYNDNVEMLSYRPAPESAPTGYQLYLSNYPVQVTNGLLQMNPATVLQDVGPLAGNKTVLYKETSVTMQATIDTNTTTPALYQNQYPSAQSSAVPTNKFYTPHLYITVLVYNEMLTDVNVQFSLFAKVKQTKVGAVESTMGRYAEFLDAQCRLLTRTAVTYDPGDVAGYTFPMWKYGGVRPELMISATDALRYFNRVAANADQAMTSQGDLQTAYQDATTMSAFDAAFGDPALNLPQWITLMDVGGITSGLIRAYPPPLKFADNGNTLMF